MGDKKEAAGHAEREAANLRGRHAVVTGGGRGIGLAVTEELARIGARVTIMGRDRSTLEQVVRSFEDSAAAEVAAVRCDIADARQIAKAFAEARERYGNPHILVNNAGQAEAAPFEDTSSEIWDRAIAVNLTGAFHCTQQVLPAMLVALQGRIVNIASTAGLRGYARMTAYCAAKHGMIGLTRALALETAKRGVTVNAVCPGYTDTDMLQQGVHNVAAARGVTREEALGMFTRVNPLGRLILPEEVASAVGWLCSELAGGITGETIVVAGGEVT